MKSRISLLLKTEDDLPISHFEKQVYAGKKNRLSTAIGLLPALVITAPKPANAQIETVLPEVRTILLPTAS